MKRHWRAALVALCSATVPVAAVAQDVDALVQKNLSARGGVEALKAVGSVQISGTASNPRGEEATFTLWLKRPNLMRQELKVRGETVITAFDGTQVWVQNPMTGGKPRAVTGPEAQATGKHTDFDGPFVDYKSKGVKIAPAGREDVDGRPADKLELTFPDGRKQVVHLDATTGLVVKTTVEADVQGKRLTREERLSDWRKVDTILLPFRTELRVNGKPMSTFTVKSAKVNPDVAEDVFKLPTPNP